MANVSYLDENGGTQTTTTYSYVTDSTSPVTWTSGTYVVGADYDGDGDIDVDDATYAKVEGKQTEFVLGETLLISGDITLIIADGFSLSVSATDAPSGTGNCAIVRSADTDTLTITAQSTGDDAGKLTATGGKGAKGTSASASEADGKDGGIAILVNTITVNAGNITVTGGQGGNGGIYDNESYGGNGGNGEKALTAANLIVNNGTLIANGGKGGQGGKGDESTGDDGTTGQAIDCSDTKITKGSVIMNGGTDDVGAYSGGEITNGTNPVKMYDLAGNELSFSSGTYKYGETPATQLASAKTLDLVSVSSLGEQGGVTFTTLGTETAKAWEGTTVTVAGVAVEGYYITSFTSEQVTITDNTFTMPDEAVTVTAIYAKYDDRIVVDTATYPEGCTLTTGKTYKAAPYAGNGGMVKVTAGGTLNTNGAGFSGNSVTRSQDDGGAIHNQGTVNVSGGSFISNSTQHDGGAIYNKGGTTIISGTDFTGNYAKVLGGAITTSGGKLDITSATFTGNVAGSNGGAIFNSSGCVATLTDVAFCGNTAKGIYSHEGGGAIENTRGGIMTLSNVTFEGNTAQFGGAIYNYTLGTINLTGSVDLQTDTDTWVNEGYYNSYYSTEENSVVNWDLTQVTDAAQSTVTINGFQRYSNVKTEVADKQQKLLVNQTITVNVTQAEGDYVLATGDFDLTTLQTNLSTAFTVKTSDESASAAITVNGDVVELGTQAYKLALVESEEAGADQLVLTAFSYSDRQTVSGSLELESGKTYTAKPCDGDGGAVCVEEGGTLTGNNVTFANNTAYSGGAIKNAGTVTVSGNASFIGNSAVDQYGNGGAIYNRDNGTVNFTGSSVSFSDNYAQCGGAISNVMGGTISFSGASVNFSNNTGDYAGAVYNCNGTVNLNGETTFSGNKVTGSESTGGAIRNDSGTVNMANTVTLATATDTVYNAGTLNWNLTGENTGKLVNYQYLTNDSGKLTLTVKAEEAKDAKYVIATGSFTDTANKDTFTLTGVNGQDDVNLSVGHNVSYNNTAYRLAVEDSELVLSVVNDYTLVLKDGVAYKSTDGGTNLGDTVTLEGLTYDAQSATWTMNDFTFHTAAATAVSIQGDSDVTINVTGDNVITGGDSAEDDAYGLKVAKGLTICGSSLADTLTVTAGNATHVATGFSSAFNITDKLTLNSITVNAAAGTAGIRSFGVKSPNLLVENADLTASGNTAGVMSYGVMNELSSEVSGTGKVTASAGAAGIRNAVSCSKEPAASAQWDGEVLTWKSGTYMNGSSPATSAILTKTYDNHIDVTSTYTETDPYELTENAVYTAAPNAVQYGGMIKVEQDGHLTGTDVTFANNAASLLGGALFNSGMMTITGTAAFTGNKTTGTGTTNGGAIYNLGTVTLENATFSGNMSAYSGGAILNYSNGTITITGTASFTGNKTTGTGDTYGGALCNKGTMTVKGDAVFDKNEAGGSTGYGSAINQGGTLTFEKNLTVSNNISNYCGAVNAWNGTMTVSGKAVFSGNKSNGTESYGGAIMMDDAGTVTLAEAEFTGNAATTQGGAIWIGAANAVVNLNGKTTFSGNTATEGGAIYIAQSTALNMANTVTLATSSDTVYNKGTLNWNLTGDTTGKLEGYQYLTNETGKLTVTVSATQKFGKYVLATGDMTGYDTDETGKYTFTLTGIAGTADVDIKVGDKKVNYGTDIYYSLSIDDKGNTDASDDELVLKVGGLLGAEVDDSMVGKWFKKDEPINITGTYEGEDITSFTFNGNNVEYDTQAKTWSYSFTSHTDTQGTDYDIVISTADESETTTYTLKVDTVAPEISDTGFLSDGEMCEDPTTDKVWFKQGDDTARLNTGITDDTSGVDNTMTTYNGVQFDGTGFSIATDAEVDYDGAIDAHDVAGNGTSCNPGAYGVDGTGPTVDSIYTSAFKADSKHVDDEYNVWVKLGDILSVDVSITDNRSGLYEAYAINVDTRDEVGYANGAFSYLDTSAEVGWGTRYDITATDNVGNANTSATLKYGVDGTGPTIGEATVSGGNVYETTDGTWIKAGTESAVTTTITDELSGVKGADLEGTEYKNGKFTFAETDEADLADHTITATDNVGNKNTAKVKYGIDGTGPAIGDATVSGSYKSGESIYWVKKGATVAVSATVTDAKSGVKEVKFNGDTVPAGEGSTYTKAYETSTEHDLADYTFDATDNVDNAATTKTITIGVDGTGPTIGAATFGGTTYYKDAKTGTVWFQKGDTTATLTTAITDAKSGVKTISDYAGAKYADGKFTGLATTTEGAQSSTITATDNVGNATTSAAIAYSVDGTGPSIQVTFDPESSPAEPTSLAVTVSAAISDGTGSGVKSAQYQIDGGEWTDYTTAFTVTHDCTVAFKATDNVGNVTTVTKEMSGITPITITAESATKTYDGTALTAGYTWTGFLVEGDELVVTVEGTLTDAGTAENKVASYKVMRGATDVTGKYVFADSVSGTLTVTKRDVTLTSASDSKVYDGTALANATVTVTGDGWAEGEGATYDVTGSQTAVGSSKNTFAYALNEGTKAANYNVTTVEGVLAVTPNDTLITITADSATKTYDGKALTAGYSWTGSLAAGDTLSVTVEGVITDAGSAANKVAGWKIVNAAGEDVTSFYSNVKTADGTLTVTKRDVTLTSASDSKTYDGAALTTAATVTAVGFVEGEGATYAGASITDVGTVANAFDYTLNANTKAANYNIVKKEEGSLTVTKRAVTLESGSATKEYDGKPLTAPVTVGGDGFAAGEGAAFDVTGSQTDVGASNNAFTYELNDGTKASNYDVTVKVGTLVVTSAEAEEVKPEYNPSTGTAAVVVDEGETKDTHVQKVTAATTVTVTNESAKELDVGAVTSSGGNAVVTNAGEGTLSVARVTARESATVTNGAEGTLKVEAVAAETIAIDNDGTMTVTGAVATSDVTIHNDGHLDAQVATELGNVKIVNTSKNTLTGAVAGKTITVTEAETEGRIKDATLTATDGITFNDKQTLENVTLGGAVTVTKDATLTLNGTLGGEAKIANAGTLVWDLADGKTTEVAYTLMNGNTGNLGITVNAKDQTVGSYTLVTGYTDTDMGAWTLKNTAGETFSLTVGGEAVKTGERAYTLAKDAKTNDLVLSVVETVEPVLSAQTMSEIGYDATAKYFTLETEEATVRLTAKDALSNIAAYSTDGGETWTATEAGTALDWTKTFDVGLEPGEAMVSFAVRDAAGNVGTLDFAAGSDTLEIDLADFKNRTIKFEKEDEVAVGFKTMTGTAKNDTVTFGAGAVVELWGGKTDFGTGTNTVKVEKNADVTFAGEIENLSSLTVVSGAKVRNAVTRVYEQQITEFAAGSVEMTEKSNTVSLGNFTDTAFGTVDFGAGNDTLRVGSDSTFASKALDFGDGSSDALRVGARSTAAVDGAITGVRTITASSGKATTKKVDGEKVTTVAYTTFAAGDVTMTADKSDTVSFANYTQSALGKVTLGEKSDTFKIGNYAESAVKSLDFGTGNDKLTVGKGTTATIEKLDFGDGKSDSLSVGADSTLTVTDLDVDSLDKLSLGKGATLYLGTQELVDAAQEKFGKYANQIQLASVA